MLSERGETWGPDCFGVVGALLVSLGKGKLKENLITIFRHIDGCSRREQYVFMCTVNNTRSSGLKLQQRRFGFAVRELFFKEECLWRSQLSWKEVENWPMAHVWRQPKPALLGLLAEINVVASHGQQSAKSLTLAASIQIYIYLGNSESFFPQSLNTSHCSPCFPSAVGEQWAPGEELQKGLP